jgi:hypothetical protein
MFGKTMNSYFFSNGYLPKMESSVISMLRNSWITHIIFSVLLLSLLISCPVSGEISSTNSSDPVWSDPIGIHRTLISVSGDGNYVIAGSDTGVLRLYAKSGTILWTYRNEGKSVRSVALSRSGDFAGAVFVNEDAPSSFARGEVFVYNRDGVVLWNFADDPTVEWISLSDDGNSIYVSGTPGLYSFYNNGTVIGKNILPSRIWALDSARDGSFAVGGSKISGHQLDMMKKDGVLSWNLSTKVGFGSTAISPDDGNIAAAGYSHLYSLDRNGTVLWQFTGSSEFTSVAVSRDGNYTVAGSQYYVQTFNRTGTLLWQYIYKGMVNDVAISDDGEHIVAGTSEGIYVFDQKGKVHWVYATPTAVLHVSIENNGSYFAAGTTDSIYFFNIRGDPTIADEPAPTTPVLTPSDTFPAQHPTTKPSPVPSWLTILAIFCIGIVVIIHNRGWKTQRR